MFYVTFSDLPSNAICSTDYPVLSYRAVAITAILLLTSITAEQCNNRSNRDICVFSFFIRLWPSRFTLCACVLNIK